MSESHYLKPVRIFASALALALMLALSAYAWDGIAKRLIICLGLSLGCSLLLLLPKLSNKLTIPLFVLYLAYVPLKSFQRMELPFHDMTRIMDGVTLLSVTMIICVYFAFFLVTQRSNWGLGGGSLFLLILFLVEYYVVKFRGDVLRPSDLGAVKTAVSVLGSYDFSLSPEAVYTVLYFLFFSCLGFQIRIRMNRWVHIGVSAASLCMIGGWYYTVMVSPYPVEKEINGHYWNMTENQLLNGTCMSFFVMLRESRLDVPGDYSEEAVRAAASEAVILYDKSQGSDVRPDIIMIMNEAWSDLSVLGQLETTEDYMPFVNSLSENTVKGNLYVSILGGLTANTEFEALTGNSLALLSPTVIPYQNQVNHDMPSLARVLEASGYETMSMHPSGSAAWNRGKVYPFLGFDEFIYEANWQTPYEYLRGFLSDSCNFHEIVYRYENRNEDAPFFLFDVTIQNHSGYYGEVPLDIGVKSVGGIPAEEIGYIKDLETYLNLMKITDTSFGELVTYFAQVEEPVIVCMFGDHQPILENTFYEAIFSDSSLTEREENLKKYIIPYVIWANYEVDWVEYGDISANYLPAVLAECSGIELPPFYKFLSKLRETYPVLTTRGCVDNNGNLVDILDIWETELVQQYRMLEYNQLYVKDYLNGIFVKEETAE